MKRMQCRICKEFMDFKEDWLCSEECREALKVKHAGYEEMLQRIDERNREEARIKNEKRRILNEKRIEKRAAKKRSRAERAETLKKKVMAQAAQIRSLKQSKPTDFYSTREWQELRYRAIRTHGRVCMCCRTTEGQMHVDHIKPRSKFPNLELCFENLQVLCRDCNLGKSNKDETDWRSNTRPA